MNTAELLSKLKETTIDSSLFASIETKYGIVFPNEIRKIISYCKEGVFFDGATFCRLLSNDEILHANEYLHVNFVTLGIIPLFDTGENDFIVFDYKNNEWLKFNIVDESQWGRKKTLKEVLTI